MVKSFETLAKAQTFLISEGWKRNARHYWLNRDGSLVATIHPASGGTVYVAMKKRG